MLQYIVVKKNKTAKEGADRNICTVAKLRLCFKGANVLLYLVLLDVYSNFDSFLFT